MNNQSQSFSDKIIVAIIVIFFLKLVYTIFQSPQLGIGKVVGAIIFSLIVFFILALIARGIQDSLGSSGSGSNVLIRESLFSKIQERYRNLAKKYIEEKKYREASHVYFKLLKDKYSAAETLEQGKLYNEAALMYLKHVNNKYKAAECFEKGSSYNQAIKLYIELEQYEKVGDVNLLLGNRAEANKWFTKVVDDYKENHQYVKAALILRNKMNDTAAGQELLLEGWKNNRDAYNCLNNYFENIKDYEVLNREIKRIYENETNSFNKESFLQLLKHEYQKDDSLKETTKAIAYEIIAEKLQTNKQIASELIYFNKDNAGITKDVMKFKAFKKIKIDF